MHEEGNLGHALCLELLGLRIGLGIIEQIEICTEMSSAQCRAEIVQAVEWICETLLGTIIFFSGGGSSGSSIIGGGGRGSGGGSYKT